MAVNHGQTSNRVEAMSLLGRFWPHLIGAALLTTALIVVNGWRKDSKQLEVVEQEYADYKTQVRVAAETKKEVSDGFQKEITALRDAVSKQPAPVVRLCNQPAPAAVDRPTARDHDPAPTPGPLPETNDVHRDVGPELFRLADAADLLSAQLRACQDYIGKLQKQSE
jgi:hypothetical protein